MGRLQLDSEGAGENDCLDSVVTRQRCNDYVSAECWSISTFLQPICQNDRLRNRQILTGGTQQVDRTKSCA